MWYVIGGIIAVNVAFFVVLVIAGIRGGDMTPPDEDAEQCEYLINWRKK